MQKFRKVHEDKVTVLVHRRFLDVWESFGEELKRDIINLLGDVVWGKRKLWKLREYVLDLDGEKISCYRIAIGKLRIICCIDYEKKDVYIVEIEHRKKVYR